MCGSAVRGRQVAGWWGAVGRSWCVTQCKRQCVCGNRNVGWEPTMAVAHARRAAVAGGVVQQRVRRCVANAVAACVEAHQRRRVDIVPVVV